MPAAGRWFVTPHAVRRYQERVAPWMSYAQALGALIRGSAAARYEQRHESGAEVWMVGEPHSARCIVAPSADAGRLPQLVTVLRV